MACVPAARRGGTPGASAVLAAALSLLAVVPACRSPFGKEGKNPEAWQVGRGVHGWPFFERAEEEDALRTDVLWPLASVRKAKEGGLREANFLVPILHYASEEGARRYAVRPLVDYEIEASGAKDLDLLWPIVKWREGPDDSRFEIRPILWTGREDSSSWTTLFPLYFRAENLARQRTTVFPFYWRGRKGDSSYSHLWPLYGVEKEGTWRRDSVAFPFFSRAEDPARELVEWDALAPLLHYGRSEEGTSARALPLFWHRVGPDSRETVIGLLWWDLEDRESSLRMLFPLYGVARKGDDFERSLFGGPLLVTTREGEARSVDLLWPIANLATDPEEWSARIFPVLWLARRPEDSNTHLWPILGYKREGEKRQVSSAWPFFTFEWGPDGWELAFPAPFAGVEEGVDRFSAHLFPLFETESAKDEGSGNVLSPLVDWHWDGEGSDFRVLWRLVERTRGKHLSVLAVNPLFRHETNDRGDVHWSALFHLVSRTREEDRTSWRVFWFLRL